MTLGITSSLIAKIQTSINSLTTSCTSQDFLLNAASVANATENRSIKVSTTSSLPNIFTNKIPNGFIIFVEDIQVPVISLNEQWIGLDGRVLRSDAATRTLFTWGSNNSGRLGDGTTVNRCSPGTIAGGDTTWCRGFSGNSASGAIKTDGTLWTWGGNGNGELGNGIVTSRCSPGTVAGGGTTWCQISFTGSANAAALKTDGTLWTWGSGFGGILGNGTTVNRCSPGTVAGGGTTWCGVFGGTQDTFIAIKTDGTIWTWGGNNNGQLGDGTATSRTSPGTVAGGGTTWCQISYGRVSSAAIKTDGTLWTWGYNFRGQLGDGTTLNRCSPGTVAGGGTWSCVFGSCLDFRAAIKTDGTLWTWGANGAGQLGDGTTVSRSSPGTVAGGGTIWCQVSGSGAIKTDGTLWTWGVNASGQLGDGTTVARCSPGTVVGGGTTWFQVSASNGTGNTLAIKTQ